MDKLILIKYGELTTKKDNRKNFINLLYQNLYEKLKKYNCKIVKEYARMYIEFEDKDTDNIIEIVGNTFGIHSYTLAYKVHTNIDDIKKEVLGLIKDKTFKTFKVITNRRDKKFEIPSMEFNNVIGGTILKNIDGIKVDVHNPDLYINIEIDTNYTYIYFNNMSGLGGYPVGIQGKGMLMLSGGIDSPVAGYLALKRGMALDAIYFEAIPHTSLNAREKVISLAKQLLKYTSNFNLFVVPITDLQEAIYKNCNPNYIITILRRMMYRIGEKIALNNHGLVLVNGESIGQVASQTLSSISVVNEVTKMPIIRPVACFDKLEIIDIAKKINTYDISILPYEDCCTIFVPKHPVINPKLDKCLYEENKFNYNELLDKAIQDTFVIRIEEKQEYSDLL